MLSANKLEIILASKSPRRQELIKGLDLNYTVEIYEVDESFDNSLQGPQVAEFLAHKKAVAYNKPLLLNQVLLTADTIVCINDLVLNKPSDEEEAFKMLKTITGTTHVVYTGVALRSNQQIKVFSEATKVTCKHLTDEEIWYYIKQYKPFDKAGSYGIQDWFGYTAVTKLEGCYYNVMGLPVSRIYKELFSFTG